MDISTPSSAVVAPRRRFRFSALSVSVVYLCIALPVVALTVVLTPPLQVPDENQHFFRAYQLSTGQLIGEARGGAAGTQLPSSLVALERRFLIGRVDLRSQTSTPFPINETWRPPSIPLEPEHTEFVAFTTMSVYAPFAYPPQAVTIALGRWAGLDVLSLLLLARLLNGCIAIALTACALRLLPIGREAALAVALFPMTLFQFASVSMDAGLMACAFLFTALVLRASAARTWTAGRIAAATLCGIVVCSAKIVYAPLLLLGVWPAVAERRRGNGHLLSGNVVIILVGAGVTAGWLISVSDLMLPVQKGVVPGERVAWMLHHPIEYAELVANTLLHRLAPWFMQAVGKLGWLMFWLPWPAYAVAGIGLIASCVAVRPPAERMTPTFASWALLLVLVSVALILTALFLVWATQDGIIDGVQGRYFIPLLFVVASTLASLCPEVSARTANRLYAVGLACSVIEIGAMFLTLAQGFRLL